MSDAGQRQGGDAPEEPTRKLQQPPGPGLDQATVRMQRPQPMRVGPVPPGKPQPQVFPVGPTVPARKPEEAAPAAAPAEPAVTEDTAEEAPPAKKKGRRVALALTALVVVAGLAVGGVFYGPQVLRAVGLGGIVEDATPAPAPPAQFRAALRPLGAQGPLPTKQGVSAALSGPAAAGVLGTLGGIVVDPASGDVLWDKSASTAMVPASTAKIITSAAALLALDPQATLTTKVVEGPEPGTVVLVGGGDPTISGGAKGFYPGAAKLDDLVAKVKAATGGQQVRKVRVDTSAYAGDTKGPGWMGADMDGQGDDYAAPMEPVMLDGGRLVVTNGDSARTTTPARSAAGKLAERLGVSGGASPGTAPPNARVLAEVQSPPIRQLVETLLLTSDNVLAEAMARQVAMATGAEVSFAGGAKAVHDVLTRNGFDLSGITLVDGSGLSTQNKVSPKLLGSVLAAASAPSSGPNAERTAKLRALLTGLPVAGGSGTLAERYGSGTATTGKGWVRAKTGTLNGINSLAGIVTDNDGKLLVFAFLGNGTGANADARAALDVLASALRSCGCR
ncbi:D-alanyl-D-alanine carboxypeptidase/D-alanyl-D-alanine endopeptidase [Allokutzneria albata]|uniref:D-alanyl-D-alanine carboxypeptidase / D-alanyl-D-alanine-endopeptidase (Penicillin-binding protein 4) n=1 Tax=Allokutzneria albata TaxID=211114 RepID=A0A1H0AKL8_ALLAB|nr:D-alanyl-D-alanine carboxypeptidase/D-alanyl-D-alanine-endopeptidase [Allokutzneria albata]SDN33959.1 D-alanyl-D-alanine carboxypeptidase / D-alanyl-D-alanine-endopeptidase (penicillin-binding protein 4) [Allokutzneria albata]